MEAVQLTRRTDGMIRATDEEKRAILDLLNAGNSIAEVARVHGLAIQTLVKWRNLGNPRICFMLSTRFLDAEFGLESLGTSVDPTFIFSCQVQSSLQEIICLRTIKTHDGAY